MITLTVLFMIAALTVLFRVTKFIAKLWLRVFVMGFGFLAAIIILALLII